MFGTQRVRLGRIIDASKSLSATENEALIERFTKFEEDFPQLFFAVYIADLAPNINLRELGFWLINRALLLDSQHSNDRTILLCVNSAELSASINLGFLPEQHLTEEELATILAHNRMQLANRQFASFIMTCLDSVIQHLQVHAVN